jgi:molybdenum cofactor cytidylyltransferase
VNKELSETGIILLAAGSSSRMGQSKQLLFIDGESLLSKSAKAALQTKIKNIVVVLGASEKELRLVLSGLPIDIVVNREWQKGMGSSLKTGLTFLLSLQPPLASVIILVCDQPLLTGDHITKLIEKNNQTHKPIVASRYEDTLGVPAYFEKSYFAKLLALKEDQGAKKIIKENSGDVAVADFPQGAIDLDTMEDYHNFLRKEEVGAKNANNQKLQ